MIKKFAVPILTIAALILIGAVGIRIAKAEGNDTNPPIIQRIAEKFNLSESDVETVFNEERQARHEEVRNLREERLNEAVEDGVITSDQKTALLNKWQEMWQEQEQHREEMQNWFNEQGMDETKLAPYMGFGHHGGFGGRGMGMMH